MATLGAGDLRFRPILLKNSVSGWRLGVTAWPAHSFFRLGRLENGRASALGPQKAVAIAASGLFGINHAAILRKFCAVAASKNSSLAPFRPRRRNLSNRRMRLRCANSISTFFRCRRDWAYRFVVDSWRAPSRADSFTWRAILRCVVLGQHFDFSSQPAQS